MTDEQLIEKIEEAMLVIGDFWEADDEAQQEALEIASICMGYAIRELEGQK